MTSIPFISFRQFKEETTPLPIVSLATRYIGRLTRIWNGGGGMKKIHIITSLYYHVKVGSTRSEYECWE